MVFCAWTLSKQTTRGRIPLKVLPFMNSALPKLFNCGNLEIPEGGSEPDRIPFESTNREQTANIHAIRLDQILSSWNFKRIPVSGDGNCLFYAVSQALLQRHNSTTCCSVWVSLVKLTLRSCLESYGKLLLLSGWERILNTINLF